MSEPPLKPSEMSASSPTTIMCMISGKMICNIALNRIGVLVFVDHDVPISVAEAFPYLVVFKKDLEVTYSPTKPGDGL